MLVLSQFDTAEHSDDEADTILLSFGEGNEARLTRGGALDETEGSLEEGREESAAEFLSHLRERVPPFVTSVVAELESRCAIDASALRADHVCYRTDSIERYASLVRALRSATDSFALLVESEIGGRPIATFKLLTPIIIESPDGDRTIDVVEIPSPKAGSPYEAGLEHVEFVVGDGRCESPTNDEAHRAVPKAWTERRPRASWNAEALRKRCNPGVSTKLELRDHGSVSVKFHLIPLEEVIEFERLEEYD